MDLYSISMLNGLAQARQVRPAPTFFLEFFPEAIYHETEEVVYDLVTDKPRVAPFVHPLKEGKLIEGAGFQSNTIKPAYVKDKRIHTPNKAFKRLAGEPLTGSMTNEQRLRAALVADLADQRAILNRRLELMAAEAVIYGTQTIIGDGFNAAVDFSRDTDLTDTLVSGDKWDAGTPPDIGGQLEEWDGVLSGICGFNTSHAVMDQKAWKLARRNSKFRDDLDTRRGGDTVNANIAPMLSMEGVTFKGWYGEFPIFVYKHSYIDPVDGVEKQAMPDNTVLLISRQGLQGVRHFGAIQDLDAGVRATDAFVKSWVTPEPSARHLLMQSAPIMVPYNVNAVLRRVVA